MQLTEGKRFVHSGGLFVRVLFRIAAFYSAYSQMFQLYKFNHDLSDLQFISVFVVLYVPFKQASPGVLTCVNLLLSSPAGQASYTERRK